MKLTDVAVFFSCKVNIVMVLNDSDKTLIFADQAKKLKKKKKTSVWRSDKSKHWMYCFIIGSYINRITWQNKHYEKDADAWANRIIKFMISAIRLLMVLITQLLC